MDVRQVSRSSLVYLALFPRCFGDTTALSGADRIPQLVLEAKQDPMIAMLLSDIEVEDLCNEVESLLLDDIFASFPAAKRHLQDLCPETAPRFDLQGALEQDACDRQRAKLRTASVAHQRTWRLVYQTTPEDLGDLDDQQEPGKFGGWSESLRQRFSSCLMPDRGDLDIGMSLISYTLEHEDDSLMSTTTRALFPSRISYSTQFTIMREVQPLLLRILFNFARETMPEILEMNGWASPEIPSLMQWATLLSLRALNMNLEHLGNRTLKPFFGSLVAIPELHHLRINLTMQHLVELLTDVIDLARALACSEEETRSLSALLQHMINASLELNFAKSCLVYWARELTKKLDYALSYSVEANFSDEEILSTVVKWDKLIVLHMEDKLGRVGRNMLGTACVSESVTSDSRLSVTTISSSVQSVIHDRPS